MKKTYLYSLLAFASVFFGGLLPNQVLAADVTFTCSTSNPSECNSTRNGWNVSTIDHICTTNCDVNYTSHTGTVTLVMQCDTNSPGSFTGRLTVNGVSTPLATQNCAPPAPPANITAACSAPYVNLGWDAVPGATHYALRVDYPSDPVPHLVQEDAWVGTSYNVFTPTSNTEYSAWVHACNAGGCSATAASTNFTCMPSGTITAAPCTIATGYNSCVGAATWNTGFSTLSQVYNGSVMAYSNVVTGNAQPITLNYGPNTITVRDNGLILDYDTVSATCDLGPGHWNTSYCQATPVPPPPAITVAPAQNLVRSGDNTTLDISVTAAYPVSCAIEGGTTPNTITSSQTVTTKNLTSAQVFTITCTPNPAILGVSPSTDEVRVEVVPVIEEI
jgi:hypothetical protein